MTYVGTTLLVLRSVASLVQTAWLMAAGRFHIAMLGIWEWWFYLGAILFMASSLRLKRERLAPRPA